MVSDTHTETRASASPRPPTTSDPDDVEPEVVPHHDAVVPNDDVVAKRTGIRALVGGGLALSLATVITNAGNYALNLVLARWLTPAEFADANLMVTIVLLVAAVAASLQLVAARFAGVHHAHDDAASAEAIGAWLDRGARWSGVALALMIALPATWWAELLQVESAWYFVIVSIGIPFYFVQAVRRGLLLGALAYQKVALTFLCEMAVRVGASIMLVAAGFGVAGATVGLALSFVVTGAVASRMQPVAGHEPIGAETRREVWAFVGPVAIVLLGQILINNGDVVVVKATFAPHDAGIYAAIALMGRAVFFVSWAVVTTLFPATTQRSESTGARSSLVFAGAAVVAVMGLGLTFGAWLAGEPVFVFALGPEYYGVRPYLVTYALATTLFSIANMMISQRLSMGHTGQAWLLLGAGVIQTAGLVAFHDTITTVIGVQLVVMAGFLVVVTAINGNVWRREARTKLVAAST